MTFNKKKFLNLSYPQQHKKSAELLRKIYDLLLQKDHASELIEEYNKLQEWINEPTITEMGFKAISNSYHYHLKKAGLGCKEHRLLPEVRRHDKNHASSPLPIAVYLDHIRSAHNVGSILRTVEALALGKIYFSPQTPFIDNKQVINTSMGSIEWVECQRNTNLTSLPHPIIALETADKAISLNEFIFPETFTLVVGNEEYGCSDYTLNHANYIVDIPLFGRKNSLNVANAFAIAAAEILRQQRIKH
ncbi:MAG: TrmH family RNA methyltransferase [Chlamydiota bacterium]